MFSRFIPKETDFFGYFNEHAALVVQGSQSLVAMLSVANETDEDAARYCGIIDALEIKGDEISHEVMRHLHQSFITPLDREEIHQLTTSLDEILNLTRDVAHTIALYHVNFITSETLNLARLGLECNELLLKAVKLLSSMDNGTQILNLCHTIDELESKADQEMRCGMSRLFREDIDVKDLIKYKTVYELLEEITDCSEDAAEIIEGIVLENT